MKKSIHKNSESNYSGNQNELRRNRWNFKGISVLRNLAFALLVWLPMAVSATLTLPAIPSNIALAKRFELSTELTVRVKFGETFLPSGALIAYINNDIRGAQTASVLYPATGNNVYKILVFNDKSSGDSISFKYYDIFNEKIYDISEKIEFVPDLVPDYANPQILNTFCKPIVNVTGLIPENGKENLGTTVDLFWQPSLNTTSYNLFLWEDGAAVPATPTNTNIFSSTFRLNNLKYSQLYHWKIVSVNDCSTAESSEQTFKIRQLPDLTVTDVLAPASIQSGSNFLVSFKINNIGDGNTSGTAWSDAVYVSTDQTFSVDDKLLSTTANMKQLDSDSSYTKSVTVSLPVDYTGDYYFLVKTDLANLVPELLEDNNLGKTANVTQVALKSLADILVKDIQAGSTTINPGDSLTVNWKVENIGTVPATGGWIERISLIPVSGVKLSLNPSFEYKIDLATGSTINRSKKIKVPELLKFSGDANIEVELIPLPELQEYPANKANNKAISASRIAVGDLLYLEIQTASVLENTPTPVRAIVTRSGDYSFDLLVSLSASLAGQVTIPASVTIPANQSSVVFNLSPVNNQVIDGPRNVGITATAPTYTNALNPITILDDEIPGLSATLSKSPAIEGEIITLTVSRDLVTNLPLSINLSTNKISQWTFTSALIIPANEASGSISVSITDDIIPELTGDATINASSAGLTTDQVSASIIDNDIPQVSLELRADTISESAGIYATWGIIKRVKGDDNITVNLSSGASNALFFPASITLPKGALEQQFNIGVVDNGDVDGYRKVSITGSVYISSCNCGTSAQNGGVVSADLIIADNDGPSLSVSVNPISLPEGKTNAGSLTVSRNTSPDLALDITISHNDASEVSIQTSATIPAGQKTVQVPINTINDNIEDGNQMVSVQVGAAEFTSGYGYVFVNDQNKPDLEITDIAISSNTAATNELIEITGSIFNVGFATAPSAVKLNFYLSKDKTIDAKDVLLGEFSFSAPIPQGASANYLKTVDVPNETGDYYILAKVNPTEQITELVYFNNMSDAVAFTISPEYTATAIADNEVYLPNSTVTIHGSAVNSKNEVVPNADVDVYILTSGTRRELKAKTNNAGEYSVEFVPNSNESGHYLTGACFPKQNLSVAQDNFDIPGLLRESNANIIWEMKLGQTLTGKIALKNTSEASLSQVVIIPDKLPAGCELKFDTIAVMAGNQTININFTLKATELTEGKDYEKINLQVQSKEGITLDFAGYFYCQALQGQLKSDPVSINTTMTKGKSRLYELFVYNNGAGETGTITISLPKVDWMTLMSPGTIPNLAPKDTAKVILNLSPTADMPLNTPISGYLAVNCINGIGVQIPYHFEVVSEESGGLKVDVIDEYTYYTDAKPHLKNAHVIVRHPFSGAILADGFTDADGIFSVDKLPEGSYKMLVEAEKHESFQTTITIDPGRVNEQSVFLSFQAITYTWEVVPTQIEDSYEVQLVMKYETSVPVPVVITEMPTVMPQLFNDETYPFLVTMTNKGLITALDVDITFPTDDPEYEFVTNFTKTNILAQQAIQIPVVMRRRVALKSANAIQSITVGSGSSCIGVSGTIYGWQCGPDRHWGHSNNSFSFSGRVCYNPTGATNTGPSGTPWFNGWAWPLVPNRGLGGSYWFNPITLTGPGVESPAVGCEPCLISLALNGIGCFPILGPVITNGAGILSCLISLADLEVTALDLADCGATAGGMAGTITPGVGCAYGLSRSAMDCYKDPPMFVSRPMLKTASLESRPTMPPILKQSIQELNYSISTTEALDSLQSEIMGNWDWISKSSIQDFCNVVDPFVKGNKSFSPEDIAMLEATMAGTDISSNEIQIFTTHWNNTMIAWSKKIYSPDVSNPDIVDKVKIKHFATKIKAAYNYAISRGYDNALDMYNKALATTKEQINAGRNSVCASVSINITQKVVMTREAFEGTLTIFNGNTTTAMKEIKLNLEIRDENGVISNDLFQIDTKALSTSLTGIDGTGTLGPEEKGSATVLFIPEKGAAPTVPKSYSFGGSFSYLDPFTGVTVTKPLFPVTLDVNPSPDLFLHYFMQRDILGDDALTKAIEPIVPAEFAVMIQNNGFGVAKNVRIESAQPKIVENEKGLSINFALTGSNLNGQPKQMGLTNVDFGNIPAKKATIGQWYFTSDLLGHFVSYEAKLTHLDSRGNSNLSLISGVALHELIKSVRIYGGVEDGINDFLVNEVQDGKEFPDVIYLSNGGVLDVHPAISQSTSGSIASGNHEIVLQVTPVQIGWNYIKFSDPGNGQYKIASVTREDGQVIPLDNVWQTHVTMPDGKEPVYENMLHFLDMFAADSSQKYTIRFTAKDQNPPVIVIIENVPAAAIVTPLTSVNVVFNKPIDPSTFNYEDMTLRIQGGANVMDNTVIVSQLTPEKFKIDLTTKSVENGYYVLTVQASQISDLTGTNGLVGKQAAWTQFINVPAISEFIGLPENNVGAPFDNLLIRFNHPMDKSTILPARFSWLKNGEPVSGTITITEMDTEGKLFQLSGLQAFLKQDAKYSLTVDLPNIKSLDGNNGILPQSVEWEIDQKAPQVSTITPSTDGGYDSQHRTAFTVQFDEAVKGFGLSSLELWKDGLRQPLSQLNFTKKTDSEYLFTEFRMLTYSEGNYMLKVKMKDITDLAGNSGSDTTKLEWTIFRAQPKAVTNFYITPDMGFSDTDNITATRNLVAHLTVNESNSRIQIYQTDQINPVLLADVSNVDAGLLSLPITLSYSGNLKLQAYCFDKYTNSVITEIPLFIDEAALVGIWTNAPKVSLSAQPASLQIEFSDKLLDDTKLKDYLSFDRDGQSLETKNLTVTKSTDKLYNLSGMDQAGIAVGTYSITLDLSKLQKHNSGKQGVSVSKVKWSIQNTNSAPVALAAATPSNLVLNSGQIKTAQLNGSGSVDSDGTIASFRWSLVSGPTASVIIQNPDNATTLASFSAAGSYVFKLTVTDNKGASDNTTTTVTVVSSANISPVASATSTPSSLVLNSGQTKTAQLNGSGSADSDGTIVSFNWSLVSGPVGGVIIQNPNSQTTLASFTAVGSYVFKLIVTDNQGASDNTTITVTVSLSEATNSPVARAAATPSNLVLNSGQTKTAQLDGSGSFDPDGTITSFSWSLVSGPTTRAIIQNPNNVTTLVSFSEVGSYVFKLIVTDNQGASDNTTITVTVSLSEATNSPVASATTTPSSLVLNSGQTKTAQLNGSGSADPDGTIVSFNWSLVSGPIGGVIIQNPNSQTTLASFSAVGSYVLKLTVTDNQGATDNTSITVTVVQSANIPPVAIATATPSNLVLNSGQTKTAQLNGSGSADSDGTIVSFNWSLVSEPVGGVIIQNPNSQTTLASFSAAGSYVLKLTVTDNQGATDNTSITVTVVQSTNIPPVASATATPSNLVLSSGQTKTAQLNGSGSVDQDGTIALFNWSLVSGPIGGVIIQNPNSQTTLASFSAAGSYVLKLTVTDNKGESDNTTITVTVVAAAANIPPVASATATPSNLVLNSGQTKTAQLNGSGSADSDGTIVSFNWSLVSGPIGGVIIQNPNSQTTLASFSAAGSYIFKLTVTDNQGTTDNTSITVTVVASANIPPVAQAGYDLIVNKGATVSLDGSASTDADGNALTYKWTAPAGITLSSTTAMKPTFTAPNVIINTSYTITLVVNDGFVNSPADQVVITIKTSNTAPVANAGSDLVVNKGATVSLDGTASTDPDRNPLTYKWTAPAGIILSSATDANPTFTAPSVIINTSYTLTLKVNDGLVDSPADQVVITIKTSNSAPTANAGSDQVINEGSIVTLNGSASTDPDSNPLTYKWTVPAGIKLSSATAAKPTFTAPEVSINTSYTLTLMVNDGLVNSTADQVVITIKQVNKAPLANAGPNQSVNELATVTLDASASSDPDANPITYLWTSPAGITLSSSTAAKPTFTVPEITADQTYTFSLIVSDGLANSTPSTITVSAKNIGNGFVQTINVSVGWNIISSSVIPSNSDLKTIFQPLIDAGKLVKVMNEAGKTLEDFGVFGGWKNSIGDLIPGRGYKIIATENIVLELNGEPVPLPMVINLNKGWNIIAYPSDQPQDAMTIFQPLIDSGKLIKVLSESGLTIEDFGIFGGWKNNIGNLMPNKGYKVYMNSAGTITIPAGSTKMAVILPEIIASTHFRKAFIGNGTDHMTVNMVNLAKGGFKIGDEIGIFDGNLCVGAVQIGPDQLVSDQISIPASSNDEIGKVNGFISGNQVVLRLFRNNQEYLLKPELQNNSKSIFEKDASMFASAQTELAIGITEIGQSVSVKYYPNPFKEQLTIEVAISDASILDVEIFDAGGRLVRSLFHGSEIETQTLFWDGKNDRGIKMAPGSYFLKVNDSTKKVILTR